MAQKATNPRQAPKRGRAEGDGAKERLARLLDQRVFNPILRASPKRYSSESDRKALERLKAKTESERDRVRRYPSAAYLRRQYERKIKAGSVAAARASRTAERLGMPRLADAEQDFFALCDRLGVARGQPARHRPHRPHPEHKKSPEAKAAAKQELERIRAADRRRRAAKRPEGHT